MATEAHPASERATILRKAKRGDLSLSAINVSDAAVSIGKPRTQKGAALTGDFASPAFARVCLCQTDTTQPSYHARGLATDARDGRGTSPRLPENLSGTRDNASYLSAIFHGLR